MPQISIKFIPPTPYSQSLKRSADRQVFRVDVSHNKLSKGDFIALSYDTGPLIAVINKVRSKYDEGRGWTTPSSVQLDHDNTPKRRGLCRFEVIYFHGESEERNFEPDIVDDVP